MIYTVLEAFNDKETKVFHDAGTEYQTSSATRAKELKDLGFIEEGSDGILSENVETIIQSVTGEMTEEELVELLNKEKSGSNRKTVRNHIENLLKAGDKA